MSPLAILAALALGGAAQPARTLDDFSDPARWPAAASDGVAASARPFEGGVRLDYDFSRGSGYAFVRRPLPLDLPENFELRFRLRGQGAANALEIKLTDASGENVWWHRKADFVPPGEWTTVRIKRRQIEFAWGPTQDRTLRRAAALEFVVAAGSGGGRGWIAIDDLEIVPLPVPPDPPPPIVARAPAGRAAAVVDGDRATAWTAPAGMPLDLDLGFAREFGGLVLRWAGEPPADVELALSADGRNWTTPPRIRFRDAAADWIRLEESEARYIRLRAPGNARLAEVEVRPLAFGASANAFVAAIAAQSPRGRFPRGFVGEQNYWTLVATPAGGNSGLIDESGAIEVGRGGFSIEPFVRDRGRLLGWADVEASQSLAEGHLPIPSVNWRGDGWTLVTTAFADERPGAWLNGRHVVTNTGSTPRDLELVLAVRPFQVNPPQQFLNITGGVSPIRRIDGDQDVLRINDRFALRLLDDADAVAFSRFEDGIQPFAPALDLPVNSLIDDPAGLASAAFVHRLRLAPGESRTIGWVAPLAAALPRSGYQPIEAGQAAARWRAALGDVRITGPAAARPALDTLRTALAHVLATREGAALRPGSRSYARAWIRDGAMMSTALLRMGVDRPAIDFLDWYAPFQYPGGKVPCCVDARGADPVPEHDSHGELIHLVAQVHRFAPDAGRLRRLWPRVRAAADHIETLRQSTRIAANRQGRNRPLHGLLPPSISHEGYSARPAYSYWDDFWALAGLQDAAWIAGRLGLAAEARQLAARADAFRADIIASLGAAREVHDIAFIPGAADLGDFDATSTTIGLSVAGLEPHLPPAPLRNTFERYWTEFLARRDVRREWDAYTPYEWRNVGAFVRLGWRDRVATLFDFFMADRRPAAWNQWAEVVGREPRAPRFIGDMPHGWVASDYINALLDMLAYERADGALMIGAGVPDAWLAGEGIAVERLRTPYGPLSFTLGGDARRLRIAWRLDGALPAAGLHLAIGGHRLSGASGRAEFAR